MLGVAAKERWPEIDLDKLSIKQVTKNPVRIPVPERRVAIYTDRDLDLDILGSAYFDDVFDLYLYNLPGNKRVWLGYGEKSNTLAFMLEDSPKGGGVINSELDYGQVTHS